MSTATGGEDPRLLMMSALLQLEREVRRVPDRKALEFLVVNETHRLVHYRQAVLFLQSDLLESLDVAAVSGVAFPDSNAAFLLWLKQLVRQLPVAGGVLSASREIVEVTSADVPDSLRAGWQDWGAQTALWIPLLRVDGVLLGGLWLLRDQAWQNAEKALLERLADAYAHGFQALHLRQTPWLDGWRNLRAHWRWVMVALLVIILFPVRQTVLAPAQLVARQPLVISAPTQGVVKSLFVQPNQVVKTGDLLLSLEDTELRNQHALALQAYKVAEAKYLRAGQKAFADIDSKSELDLLKAEAEEKLASVNYAAELLRRIEVRAPQDGVAVFSDVSEWQGKPVNVGEKIMQLANVNDTWLEVWLPVDDAIRLEEGTSLRFFLNIDPLHAYDGVVRQTSYEAEVSPQQVLSYRLKADLTSGDTLPRLGLKGTAKLYGDRVPLGYYLFRRPLIAMRRWMGW